MSSPLTTTSLLQLVCFVRVVEAASFAEAGRRLGMTISGVSKAVTRLEAEHGVRLLHRSTRALSLTDEGEQVFGNARDVLREYERLGLALSRAADGGQSGQVRISAPPGFTRACFVPVLPGFMADHPEINIEVQASYKAVDLADEGVDLALRAGPLAGWPGHVSQTPVVRVRHARLYRAPRHARIPGRVGRPRPDRLPQQQQWPW